MKLFCDCEKYKIYNGSMLDMLEVIEQNSIDSIVCDPPYELGFMGKKWDSSGIAFQPKTWEKCLKVLKPGGYLLAFGGSRTFHRIAVAIEDAGFEIRDTIMWLYGSGFPKSHDISKAIDKKLGARRKVVGSKMSGIANRSEKSRHTIGASKAVKVDITLPSSDLAKQWQGWGTALKPAYEPIIVARKPFKSSVAENIMKYGVGGINIDECRVGNEEFKQGYLEIKSKGIYGDMVILPKQYTGRFPANVIHDGSEEVISGFPNTSNSGPNLSDKNAEKGIYSRLNAERLEYKGNVYDDFGSASRYFYCAKASKKDRDEGLEMFDSKYTASAEFRPNHMEKALNGESGNPYGRWQPRKNIHPTVKPAELLQYLVRLVSPKGATILDPFMGSGSTGKAAMFENRERDANYKFIGIDLEKEYCEIAEARIDYALNKYEYDYQQELKKAEEQGQLAFDLFGDVKETK